MVKKKKLSCHNFRQMTVLKFIVNTGSTWLQNNKNGQKTFIQNIFNFKKYSFLQNSFYSMFLGKGIKHNSFKQNCL